MNSGSRALCDALTHAGFVRREGRHVVYRHATGRTVVLSRTPSDGRAILNERADVRRALRAVGAEVTI